MCFAIPGKVIALDGEKVVIDYGIARRKASNRIANAKLNDYVIVRGKIILEVVPRRQAVSTLKEFARISRKKRSAK
ncbi:MAG: HypC/HybG/HupF family hydrogenase formation chaperone [archaeon]